MLQTGRPFAYFKGVHIHHSINNSDDDDHDDNNKEFTECLLWTRHCAKDLTCSDTVNPQKSCKMVLSHFIGKNIKALR